MIDDKIYKMKKLNEYQNEDIVVKNILTLLKEHKLSLSQTRTIFNQVLVRIEDDNIINL